MTAYPDVASSAALLRDPSRASILTRLLDGRSWTASELARAARVSGATASTHLGKLVRAGWIAVHPQGRYRYFRLAGPEVAALLETLALWAPETPSKTPGERRASEQLQRCRLCYDHLAGRIGVAIYDHLLATEALRHEGADLSLTAHGRLWLRGLGMEVDDRRGRPCMDWSERRFHLAGPLGKGLAEAFLAAGWLQRDPKSRALWVTPRGETGLRDPFGIENPGRLRSDGPPGP